MSCTIAFDELANWQQRRGMDHRIVEMLRDALDRAERGEIKALALVAVTDGERPLVGYLDRDRTTEMQHGAAELLHQLIVSPQFDDDLDAQLPAMRLAPA